MRDEVTYEGVVPISEFERLIDVFLPLLERAGTIGRSTYEPFELWQKIRSGDFVLWAAMDKETGTFDSIAVLEWVEFHRAPAISIVVTAALDDKKARDWDHLLGGVSKWAKLFGARRIVFEGRSGWWRKLKTLKPQARKWSLYELEL